MKSTNMTKHQSASDKKFISRNSLLTDIFQSPEGSSLYYGYFIVFVSFFVKRTVTKSVKSKSLSFGLVETFEQFANLHQAAVVWCACFMAACVVFFLFKIWARYRLFDKRTTKVWDWSWGTLLFMYYIYTFLLLRKVVLYFNFSLTLTSIISTETVRLLMKVHSFIRNKAPLSVVSSDQVVPSLPKLSQFLYFLFAPTLIYRDSYPLRKETNWYYVGLCLIEIISEMLLFHFVFDEVRDDFINFGLQKTTFGELLVATMGHVFHVSFLVILLFCYGLHSLQNFWAEITRFDDRFYYGPWWSTTTFSQGLREWNHLVEDWLFYYVYVDFKKYICDNRFLAGLAVFLVSFSVHEFIFNLIGRGGFPVCFLSFMGLVFPTAFVKPPKHKIFIVINLCLIIVFSTLGIGVYTVEYFAKLNIPFNDTTPFHPTIFTYDCILWTLY